MKDLEDDAIRAQAVIAKAQELKNDDTRAASNQNGDSGVGVCFGGKIFPPFFCLRQLDLLHLCQILFGKELKQLESSINGFFMFLPVSVFKIVKIVEKCGCGLYHTVKSRKLL